MVDNYDTICMENLNVKGMSATCKPRQDENGKYLPNGQSAKSGLNKAILDMRLAKLAHLEALAYENEKKEILQEIDKINNFLDSISKWKPEVLLVNDDQATYSLLETHHPLLKGIPIVFSGVNYPNWELIGQYNNVTGFHDKIDFRKNLEMVHKLTGKNHIYTILDFTFLDRKVRNDIDNQLKSTDIISNLDWHLDKNDTRKEAEKHHEQIAFLFFSEPYQPGDDHCHGE